MGCFTLGWALQLCVWIVIVIALVSILRAVIPWIESWAGLPSIVITVLNIVIWAVIAIAALYIIFGILSCVFSGGLMLHHY